MSVSLDAETAAFTEGGLSMHAASRDAANVANLSRGLACRVCRERTRVTVFLLASHSGDMLADFRANGRIAVVFSQPSTHRTIQLKGTDAAVEPMQDGDHVLVAKQQAGFVRDLTSLGYPNSLPETLLKGARGDIVAVGFTIAEAFVQTPGPSAGKRLEP